MSITIKDIAKIANVSHTTVSRALNNSPLINEQTKNRIKAIAKQYNYTPNYSAKSLVLDKSYNIGLFFSTITLGTSSSFFYEVVTGVNQVIKEKYNLIVKGIDDYKEFNRINKKNFDGIIVMSQSIKDNMFIHHLQEQEIPFVVLNRQVEMKDITTILSDDRIGAFNAVEYLILHGHKKIALIEGKEGFKTTEERKQGFLEAIIKHGITVDPDYIVKGNYDMESGYYAMEKILKGENQPTAVFCSNDDMAVGAMKSITEKGLNIPNDMSVVGFDDTGFSAYLSPALTTVKRPTMRISQEGTKKLMELIEDRKNLKEKITYIHTELVIRESVKQILS